MFTDGIVRTFSYGGGVQSTAALVLASQAKINYRTFLFANVGDDSENPETLTYVRDVAIPFATRCGIALIEIQRKRRDGTPETLVGRIYSTARSVPIPARLGNGMPGKRTCTTDFKIRVIAKWQKEHGATQGMPAVCGLGISIDEWHRAKTDSGIAWQTLDYPLLDMRLSRRDCEKIISSAGLPVPPKSSCFFCPYHTQVAWTELKRKRPDLFERAVAIEHQINDKQQAYRSVLRLHSSMMPLEAAVGDQATFFDIDASGCESGFCFT